MPPVDPFPNRDVFTVSRLNSELRAVIEVACGNADYVDWIGAPHD